MRSQSNILASITQSTALSCPSPGRFCQPSKLYLSFHLSCSSPSLAQTCPPVLFCRLVRVMVGWSGVVGLQFFNRPSDLFHQCQGLQLITDEMDLIWTLTAGQTPAQTRGTDRRGGQGEMKPDALTCRRWRQQDHLCLWSATAYTRLMEADCGRKTWGLSVAI